MGPRRNCQQQMAVTYTVCCQLLKKRPRLAPLPSKRLYIPVWHNLLPNPLYNMHFRGSLYFHLFPYNVEFHDVLCRLSYNDLFMIDMTDKGQPQLGYFPLFARVQIIQLCVVAYAQHRREKRGLHRWHNGTTMALLPQFPALWFSKGISLLPSSTKASAVLAFTSAGVV